MQSFKKQIPAEKINEFCKTEFGSLPTNPTPAEVYHADDSLSFTQRIVNIANKCYGQACDEDEAGYIGSRFEMFL